MPPSPPPAPPPPWVSPADAPAACPNVQHHAYGTGLVDFSSSPLVATNVNLQPHSPTQGAWFDGTTGVEYTGNNDLYQEFSVLVRVIRDASRANETVLELRSGNSTVVFASQGSSFTNFKAYVV